MIYVRLLRLVEFFEADGATPALRFQHIFELFWCYAVRGFALDQTIQLWICFPILCFIGLKAFSIVFVVLPMIGT